MKIQIRQTLMVLTLSALGTVGLQTPAFSADTHVTIAVQQNPNQLDPVMLTYLTAYRVLPNIFETLIDVDYQGGEKLVPGLATSWTRIDDKTMELKLREGVKFHDGNDFTAEDVVFSFGPERRAKDQPGGATYVAFLSTIESVEAIDDYTVRVHTSVPDPILELRLSGWSSQIVSKDAFEAAGSWDVWSLNPVGTGNYQLAEYIPDDRLVLKLFDEYWGENAKVDTISFEVVPELATRIAGLASGDYDIISDVSSDQIKTVEDMQNASIKGGTIRNHRTIKYDLDNPWLKDVRVRKAVNLAIDRQLIVDTIWGGRLEVTNGFQWPSFGPLYDAERKDPEYNPEKARQLLAEAGYNGEVIAYRIRNEYYPSETTTAQAIKAMLEAVGFNIDLQIKENWDQVRAEPGTGIRDGSGPPLFNDPISGLWRSYGGGLEGEHWQNEEFDRLGEILLGSMDVKERAAAHKAMLDIWHDIDPPATILHAMGSFYGVQNDVDWAPYEVFFVDLGPNNLSLK